MKCDDCLNLLESYVDGEASDREAEQLTMHLATCASCHSEFQLLTAEGELYARYDRELEISPSLWNGIAARLTEEQSVPAGPRFNLAQWFSGLLAVPLFRFAMPALALIAIAVVIGLAYWQTRPQPPQYVARTEINYPGQTPSEVKTPGAVPQPTKSAGVVSNSPARMPKVKANRSPVLPADGSADQSDVLFIADNDMAERDTTSHLEQAQNLLVSIRDLKFSDDDQEVDVSYEKAESRRLLNENIMLRREAETAGKFPAKSMLGSLEPFLIDIANLPDKAKPSEVRQITDRVQRTEIVAELRGY